MPFKADQVSGAIPAKSATDIVPDSSSSSATKLNVDSAFAFRTAPSTSSKVITGVVGSSGANNRAVWKEKHQTAVTAATTKSIVPVAVPNCSPQADVKVTRGPGDSVVTSSIDVVLDSTSRASSEKHVDAASITAAVSLSTDRNVEDVEPFRTKREATKGMKRHGTTNATVTATVAWSAEDRSVDTDAIPAAAPTKINDNIVKIEMPGSSAEAIEGMKRYTATSTNTTTDTAATVTEAATRNKDSPSGKLDPSSKSARARQAKKRQAAASAATSTTFACAAKKQNVDTTANKPAASNITSANKTVGLVKPFVKSSDEVMGRKNHTASTSTTFAGTRVLADSAQVASRSTSHALSTQGDRALQSSQQPAEAKVGRA